MFSRWSRGLLLVSLMCATANAQQSDSVRRAWNEPVEPLRLIGNIHYVGVAGLSAFLITSDQGHVLIDGGLEETAPRILANIRALGFDPRDVRLLLNSHAHYDHAGGLAELKRATGAPLWIARGDADLVQRGGRGDFFFGDREPYPPAAVDSVFEDGVTIELPGHAPLRAHATGGHTRGCTTWQTSVIENGRRYDVLLTCSFSILDYRFTPPESYPGIAADFARTFARLESLPCDVFFAPHPGFFDLAGKRRRLTGGENPFVDPEGCRRYIQRGKQAFETALERQRGARRAPGKTFDPRGPTS